MKRIVEWMKAAEIAALVTSRFSFRWVCVLVSLGLVVQTNRAAAGPMRRDEQPPRTFVVRGARLFDGSKTFSGCDVLVGDGRIQSVGVNVEAPTSAEVVDGTGATLLPGLIDAHTHLFGENALERALIFGVTTELDMFSDPDAVRKIKTAQAAGRDFQRAELFSAGILATAPGGHPTQLPFPFHRSIPTISAPGEAQLFVDARIAEGSDYIKIVFDDFDNYSEHLPTITTETLGALIASAHRRSKLAIVHIQSLQGARTAIGLGANGLAHLFVDRPPDPEFGRFARRHRAFVIPTLSALESISGSPSGASVAIDERLKPYLSATDVVNLRAAFPSKPVRASYDSARQTVRQLRAARVPILAGTDAPIFGTVHGASIHRELELFVEAGLAPAEALAAATSVPAAQFHLRDRGEIRPGKWADLLLVRGDPTRDIAATRNILAVWKHGVLVDREAYRATIEKAEQEANDNQQKPALSASDSGLVSDFEKGSAKANFGLGWSVSTDRAMGGTSTAQIKVVEGGAHDSKGSLSITGTVVSGPVFTWAGAVFFPGDRPMAPANLSTKQEISFWARGDGKTYRLMLFAQSHGNLPATQTFIAEFAWKQFTFPISQFDGMDGRDLSGILFAGGPAPGPFAFQIDDVVFQ